MCQNTIIFKFDDVTSTTQYRRDLLTAKGLLDNFSEMDIIPVPQMDLELVHSPYKFGMNQMDEIYEIIQIQNEVTWPNLEPEKIINILPLADFLGLDIFINNYLEEVRKNVFITNKNIFELFIRYPQFRQKIAYSEKELNTILLLYDSYSVSYPEHLVKKLSEQIKKSMKIYYNICLGISTVHTYNGNRVNRVVTGTNDKELINSICLAYLEGASSRTLLTDKERTDNIKNSIINIFDKVHIDLNPPESTPTPLYKPRTFERNRANSLS